MDAMSVLLQQLLVQYDGKFPRKDLRGKVVDRFDSDQMARNRALSVVERYNLDRPKPRAQAKVEQMVNPNAALPDRGTMTGRSELGESLTIGMSDDDWGQDLGTLPPEVIVQEVLVKVMFTGAGALGMLFETRKGTDVTIKSVVEGSIAHNTDSVHRGMILRRINDREVLDFASGMKLLGAEWKSSDRMTLTFQKPVGLVTESSEDEQVTSEEENEAGEDGGRRSDIELSDALLAALGDEVRPGAADFRAGGETTGNPLSGGGALSQRYRHDFAAIEKQNKQAEARTDAYRHSMAPILGKTHLKKKQAAISLDAKGDDL
jgi:hypothetical protein